MPRDAYYDFAVKYNLLDDDDEDYLLQPTLDAIGGKESGGNYDALNPDSGTRGKYQFTQGTWNAANQKYLGGRGSLDNPDDQEYVARRLLNSYLRDARSVTDNDEEIIRRGASAWYSGNPDYFRSTKPQGKYPTIDEYTRDIVRRVNQGGEPAQEIAPEDQAYYDFADEHGLLESPKRVRARQRKQKQRTRKAIRGAEKEIGAGLRDIVSSGIAGLANTFIPGSVKREGVKQTQQRPLELVGSERQALREKYERERQYLAEYDKQIDAYTDDPQERTLIRQQSPYIRGAEARLREIYRQLAVARNVEDIAQSAAPYQFRTKEDVDNAVTKINAANDADTMASALYEMGEGFSNLFVTGDPIAAYEALNSGAGRGIKHLFEAYKDIAKVGPGRTGSRSFLRAAFGPIIGAYLEKPAEPGQKDLGIGESKVPSDLATLFLDLASSVTTVPMEDLTRDPYFLTMSEEAQKRYTNNRAWNGLAANVVGATLPYFGIAKAAAGMARLFGAGRAATTAMWGGNLLGAAALEKARGESAYYGGIVGTQEDGAYSKEVFNPLLSVEENIARARTKSNRDAISGLLQAGAGLAAGQLVDQGIRIGGKEIWKGTEGFAPYIGQLLTRSGAGIGEVAGQAIDDAIKGKFGEQMSKLAQLDPETLKEYITAFAAGFVLEGGRPGRFTYFGGPDGRIGVVDSAGRTKIVDKSSVPPGEDILDWSALSPQGITFDSVFSVESEQRLGIFSRSEAYELANQAQLLPDSFKPYTFDESFLPDFDRVVEDHQTYIAELQMQAGDYRAVADFLRKQATGEDISESLKSRARDAYTRNENILDNDPDALDEKARQLHRQAQGALAALQNPDVAQRASEAAQNRIVEAQTIVGQAENNLVQAREAVEVAKQENDQAQVALEEAEKKQQELSRRVGRAMLDIQKKYPRTRTAHEEYYDEPVFKKDLAQVQQLVAEIQQADLARAEAEAIVKSTRDSVQRVNDEASTANQTLAEVNTELAKREAEFRVTDARRKSAESALKALDAAQKKALADPAVRLDFIERQAAILQRVSPFLTDEEAIVQSEGILALSEKASEDLLYLNQNSTAEQRQAAVLDILIGSQSLEDLFINAEQASALGVNQPGAGAFLPGINRIFLTERANPTTLIHEFFHAVELNGLLPGRDIITLDHWARNLWAVGRDFVVQENENVKRLLQAAQNAGSEQEYLRLIKDAEDVALAEIKADALEGFLVAGALPEGTTPRVRTVFDKLSKVFKSVYGNAIQDHLIDPQLFTPEVTEFFGELFGMEALQNAVPKYVDGEKPQLVRGQKTLDVEMPEDLREDYALAQRIESGEKVDLKEYEAKRGYTSTEAREHLKAVYRDVRSQLARTPVGEKIEISRRLPEPGGVDILNKSIRSEIRRLGSAALGGRLTRQQIENQFMYIKADLAHIRNEAVKDKDVYEVLLNNLPADVFDVLARVDKNRTNTWNSLAVARRSLEREQKNALSDAAQTAAAKKIFSQPPARRLTQKQWSKWFQHYVAGAHLEMLDSDTDYQAWIFQGIKPPKGKSNLYRAIHQYANSGMFVKGEDAVAKTLAYEAAARLYFEGANGISDDKIENTEKVFRAIGLIGNFKSIRGIYIVPKWIAGGKIRFDSVGEAAFIAYISRPGWRTQNNVRSVRRWNPLVDGQFETSAKGYQPDFIVFKRDGTAQLIQIKSLGRMLSRDPKILAHNTDVFQKIREVEEALKDNNVTVKSGNNLYRVTAHKTLTDLTLPALAYKNLVKDHATEKVQPDLKNESLVRIAQSRMNMRPETLIKNAFKVKEIRQREAIYLAQPLKGDARRAAEDLNLLQDLFVSRAIDKERFIDDVYDVEINVEPTGFDYLKRRVRAGMRNVFIDQEDYKSYGKPALEEYKKNDFLEEFNSAMDEINRRLSDELNRRVEEYEIAEAARVLVPSPSEFYSTLEHAIDKVYAKKQSVRAMSLEKALIANGAHQDELADVFFDEFVALNPGREVQRAELNNYVGSKFLAIEKTLLGERFYTDPPEIDENYFDLIDSDEDEVGENTFRYSATYSYWDEHLHRDYMYDYVRDFHMYLVPDPQFEGDEFASTEELTDAEFWSFRGRVFSDVDEVIYYIQQSLNDDYSQKDEKVPIHQDLFKHADNTLIEWVFSHPGIEEYNDTHYNEIAPSYFADMTTQDTVVEGKHGTEIIEVQSDLFQEGEKTGYRQPRALADLQVTMNIRRAEHAKAELELSELLNSIGIKLFEEFPEIPDSIYFYRRSHAQVADEVLKWARLAETGENVSNLNEEFQPLIKPEFVKKAARESTKLQERYTKLGRMIDDLKDQRAKLLEMPPWHPLSQQWHKFLFKNAVRHSMMEGDDFIIIPTGDAVTRRWGTDYFEWEIEGADEQFASISKGEVKQQELFEEESKELPKGERWIVYNPIYEGDERRTYATREEAEARKAEIDAELLESGKIVFLVSGINGVKGNDAVGDIQKNVSGTTKQRDYITSEKELKTFLKDKLYISQGKSKAKTLWRKMLKENSGFWAPRKAGMEAFYDGKFAGFAKTWANQTESTVEEVFIPDKRENVDPNRIEARENLAAKEGPNWQVIRKYGNGEYDYVVEASSLPEEAAKSLVEQLKNQKAWGKGYKITYSRKAKVEGIEKGFPYYSQPLAGKDRPTTQIKNRIPLPANELNNLLNENYAENIKSFATYVDDRRERFVSGRLDQKLAKQILGDTYSDDLLEQIKSAAPRGFNALKSVLGDDTVVVVNDFLGFGAGMRLNANELDLWLGTEREDQPYYEKYINKYVTDYGAETLANAEQMARDAGFESEDEVYIPTKKLAKTFYQPLPGFQSQAENAINEVFTNPKYTKTIQVPTYDAEGNPRTEVITKKDGTKKEIAVIEYKPGIRASDLLRKQTITTVRKDDEGKIVTTLKTNPDGSIYKDNNGNTKEIPVKETREVWGGVLKNLGVKDEELEDLGLMEFLTENPDRMVTEAEIRKILDLNSLNIQEIMRGGPKPQFKYSEDEFISMQDAARDERNAALNSLILSMYNDVTDVSQLTPREYQDAEDQIRSHLREHTISPHTRQFGNASFFNDEGRRNIANAFAEIPGGINPDIAENMYDYINAIAKYQDLVNPEDREFHIPKWKEHVPPGGSQYTELVFRFPPKKKVFGPDDLPKGFYVHLVSGKYALRNEYEHIGSFLTRREATAKAQQLYDPNEDTENLWEYATHWPESNVFGWARFDVRTDSQGRNIIYIDEIQSDWHQEGKRRGYKEDLAVSKYTVEPIYDPAIEGQEEVPGSTGMYYWTVRSPLSGEHRSAGETAEQAINRIRDTDIRESYRRVPDAPLKQSWPKFVIKRMMQYAAENGYDGVALAPGIIHIKRWGSEKAAWKRINIKYENIVVPEFSRSQHETQFEQLLKGQQWLRNQIPVEGLFITEINNPATGEDKQIGLRLRIKEGEPVSHLGNFETVRDALQEAVKLAKEELPDKSIFSLAWKSHVAGRDLPPYVIDKFDVIAGRQSENIVIGRPEGGTAVHSEREVYELIQGTVNSDERAKEIAKTIWAQMQENPEGEYYPRAEGLVGRYDVMLRKMLQEYARENGLQFSVGGIPDVVSTRKLGPKYEYRGPELTLEEFRIKTQGLDDQNGYLMDLVDKIETHLEQGETFSQAINTQKEKTRRALGAQTMGLQVANTYINNITKLATLAGGSMIKVSGDENTGNNLNVYFVELNDMSREKIRKTLNTYYQPVRVNPTPQAAQAAARKATKAEQVAEISKALSSFTRANILLAPPTHATNISSNALLGLQRELGEVPAVALDFLFQQFVTGIRSKSYNPLDSIKALGYAVKWTPEETERLHRGGLQVAWQKFSGKEPTPLEGDVKNRRVSKAITFSPQGAQIEGDEDVDFGKMTLPLKAINGFSSIAYKLLGAEDAIFYTYHLRKSLYDLARAEAKNTGQSAASILQNPPDHIVDIAEGEAYFWTFQNSTALHEGIDNFKKTIEEAGVGGPVARLMLDMIVPFSKTPSSILAKAFDLLGGSAVRATVDTVKLRNLVKSGALKEFDKVPAIMALQRNIVQQTGNQLVGWALLAGFIYGADDLLEPLTGKIEVEQKVEEPVTFQEKYAAKLRNQMGLGYTGARIRIGERTFDLNNVGPLGMIILTGAKAGQEYRKNGGWTADSLKALDQSVRVAKDHPLLKGVKDILGYSFEDVIDEEEGYTGKRIAAGNIQRFIPGYSALASLSRGMDPYERKAQTIPEMIKSGLPWSRQKLPVKEDVFTGGPQEKRRLSEFVPFNPQSFAGGDPFLRGLANLEYKPTPVVGREDEDEATTERRKARTEAIWREVAPGVISRYSGDEFKNLDEGTKKRIREEAGEEIGKIIKPRIDFEFPPKKPGAQK